MSAWVGLVLSVCALFAGAALVFTRRYRLSGKTTIALSEVLLFVITAICISAANSTGFIFQNYLASLLQWRSYNVYDILVGQRAAPLSDVEILISAQPVAVIFCTAALVIAHYCKKPLVFSAVFASSFLVLMGLCDIAASIFHYGPRPFGIGFKLLADFVGGLTLGIIATILHFCLAELADGLKTRWARCLAVFAVGAAAICVFMAGFFFLERWFLVPSPTYFEATVVAPSNRLSILTTPPVDQETNATRLDAAFDPISTPHVVNDGFQLSASKLKIDWVPRPNAFATVAAYSVFDCSPKKLLNVVKYFRPEQGQSATVNALHISVLDAGAGLTVPTSKWRGYLLSGVRKLGADQTIAVGINYNAEAKAVSLTGAMSSFGAINIRPNSRSIAFALFAVNPVQVPIRLQIGDEVTYRTIHPSKERLGARCVSRVIRTGKTEEYGEQMPSAIILVVDNSDAVGNPSPATLQMINLSAPDGQFEISSIQVSDPYSGAESPLAQGDSRYIRISKAALSKVRMYGAAVDVGDVEFTEIRSDSLSARLNRDASIQLHGTISAVETGSERRMKTQWELFDSTAKMSFGGVLLMLLGLVLRCFWGLLRDNKDGHWHFWDA